MKDVAKILERPERRHISHSFKVFFARGLAAFLGVFSLLNMAGSLWMPDFDASHWWIRLETLGPWTSHMLLFITSVFLIAFASKPCMPRWRRNVTAALTGVLCVAAIINAATFYATRSRSIRSAARR